MERTTLQSGSFIFVFIWSLIRGLYGGQAFFSSKLSELVLTRRFRIPYLCENQQFSAAHAPKSSLYLIWSVLHAPLLVRSSGGSSSFGPRPVTLISCSKFQNLANRWAQDLVKIVEDSPSTFLLAQIRHVQAHLLSSISIELSIQ